MTYFMGSLPDFEQELMLWRAIKRRFKHKSKTSLTIHSILTPISSTVKRVSEFSGEFSSESSGEFSDEQRGQIIPFIIR